MGFVPLLMDRALRRLRHAERITDPVLLRHAEHGLNGPFVRREMPLMLLSRPVPLAGVGSVKMLTLLAAVSSPKAVIQL